MLYAGMYTLTACMWTGDYPQRHNLYRMHPLFVQRAGFVPQLAPSQRRAARKSDSICVELTEFAALQNLMHLQLAFPERINDVSFSVHMRLCLRPDTGELCCVSNVLYALQEHDMWSLSLPTGVEVICH